MNRRSVADDSVTTIELEPRSGRVDAEKDPLWRKALSVVFTVTVLACTIYLWPAMLGGQTRLVIVSGQSMEPTYDLRDIVVARDGGDTKVGDIVVFEVPDGEAQGMLIIHRVLEVDDEGFFITQGDNRTTPDQWQLTEENIVGKPLAHIPKGGKVLGFIQNIWVIALLVGLVALFLLWPSSDEEDDEETSVSAEDTMAPDSDPVAARWRALDETRALDRDEAWLAADEPAVIEDVVVSEAPATSAAISKDSDRTDLATDSFAELWLDDEAQSAIDDDVMADAMAWLDEQLDGVEQRLVR